MSRISPMETSMSRILSVFKHLLLLVASAVFLFPFAWMIFGIFKTNNEIWQQPYKLFPAHWDIMGVVESLGGLGLGRYIFNSFLVGIVGTILILISAALFSYVIVFMKTKHTDLLFFLVFGTYMLPSAVTYVPSYVILAKLHLLDTLSGLIFSGLAKVFAVFYLRQSFKKMSSDYYEAAVIDGARHRQIFRHVIFPLNKSAFFTLFILTFIGEYNSYLWPSIMLKSQEKYLISQGLRQFFIQEGAYGMNWSQVMLASTIAILPLVVIFIFGQKRLVTGIMQDSGIK